MKVVPFVILALVLLAVGLFFFMSQKGAIQRPIPTPSIQERVSPTEPSGAMPSSAATSSAKPQATVSAIKADKAVIKTSKGSIEIELYPDDAPKTVENFVKKAKEGFYKNLAFHRVEDWVIQGGDPEDTGAGGGEMPTEINDKPFIVGSLGQARRGDIRFSNDAQFFITKQDSSWLNSQYTNFGLVTKGMEVVNKIEKGDKILGITIQ